MSTTRQKGKTCGGRVVGQVGWLAAVLSVIGLGMAMAGAAGWGEAISQTKWQHSKPLPISPQPVSAEEPPEIPDAGIPDAHTHRLVSQLKL